MIWERWYYFGLLFVYYGSVLFKEWVMVDNWVEIEYDGSVRDVWGVIESIFVI